MDLLYFNDTATSVTYTLSLHDALPIWQLAGITKDGAVAASVLNNIGLTAANVGLVAVAGIGLALKATADFEHQLSAISAVRSEEHTSELQSRLHLVCRLLLDKKKKPKP